MGIIAGGRERNTVSSVVFTIGAEVANVINVGLQLRGEGAGGAQGADVNQSLAVFAYLSANSDGSTLAAAPTGGVAIGTDGLAVETLADQGFYLVSESDGDIDIDITDTGTPTFHLVVVLPNGDLAVSDAVTFA